MNTAKPVLIVNYINAVEYTQIYLKSSCSLRVKIAVLVVLMMQ